MLAKRYGGVRIIIVSKINKNNAKQQRKIFGYVDSGHGWRRWDRDTSIANHPVGHNSARYPDSVRACTHGVIWWYFSQYFLFLYKAKVPVAISIFCDIFWFCQILAKYPVFLSKDPVTRAMFPVYSSKIAIPLFSWILCLFWSFCLWDHVYFKKSLLLQKHKNW